MRLEELQGEEELKKARALYEEAFPRAEKKPFELMLEKRDEGSYDMLAIAKDGEFVGMAFSMRYQEYVLLDYFAIGAGKRGSGLGSRALGLLKERYKEKKLFLDMETVYEDAENGEQRKRRKEFYLRNGMKAMDYIVNPSGVNMEVLTAGADISYAEYHGVYEGIFGEEKGKIVKYMGKIEEFKRA